MDPNGIWPQNLDVNQMDGQQTNPAGGVFMGAATPGNGQNMM